MTRYELISGAISVRNDTSITNDPNGYEFI